MNKLYIFICLLIILITLFSILIWYCLSNYFSIYTNEKIKQKNLWNYIDKLEPGDLFITGKIINDNKFQCDHAAMIAKYNGKVCILESISNDKCRENKCLIDKDYKTGPKIYDLKNDLKFSKKVREEKKCFTTVLIRKLNYKKINVTPEELNKKILNELKIFRKSDSRFEKKYNLYPFAVLGSLFWYVPNSGMSSVANIFPTSYYNDGYFCSEFIPLMMQRVGLLSYKYNARIFWPHFLTDNYNYFKKDLYSKDLFFYY